MSVLLDTDVCIEFLRGANSSVRDNLLARSPAEISLCSVVKAELLFGAHHSQHVAANLRKLREFFAPFASAAFEDAAAASYGILRAQLRGAGSEIGANDLLIAAIAIANQMTLVTHNHREFQRVPGLQLEQW